MLDFLMVCLQNMQWDLHVISVDPDQIGSSRNWLIWVCTNCQAHMSISLQTFKVICPITCYPKYSSKNLTMENRPI